MKIGILIICTGYKYWQYAKDVIESAQKHLLEGHEVEYLLFTDIPEDVTYGAKTFYTEPLAWPYPTLMRYHIFLQQEEELKKYDYLFYVDADMLFVDDIGDEILGNGITATEHPMYSLRKELHYPFETNPESAAYFPCPHNYFAGGFQGGETQAFIKAMRECKRNIDSDFGNNYIARWNEESHWNRYLFENPPAVILDPSYCYPDSLIETYYEKIWGRSYKPKLITLTKKFTTSKEGGEAIKSITKTI